MTKNMMINAMVEARCKKDGLTLYEVIDENGKSYGVYSPHTAQQIKFDVEFNRKIKATLKPA